MTQHPLTDDIISTQDWPCGDDGYEVYYDEDTLRAATDWQLEQVEKWLKDNAAVYAYQGNLLNDLRKAMRPNTTQENN